ncbi:DUF1016 N-terminal domain-containing protein [Sphingobacterium sp. JB170]|uniref:DUF1016 N-terminal domain-containing protein n=1 Tax=Sphingobacterium sp. JB170 TaxID=1434842 RepID=UPI00097E76BF|nr:DUF1016 N-terminal domain-containing protein [Sphingobacterium sp. JB170]SJN27903.1 Putative cytoplasmic protein [Sphingobacterium sp. JB170]
MDKQFTDIILLIQQSRNKAIKAVNVELINLYWNIGAYIKQKLSGTEWGDKTVDELAKFIQKNNPELKGFNKRGLYRMIQFYETYASVEFVSPVRTQLQNTDIQSDKMVSTVRTEFHFELQDIRKTILTQLSWTHHRTIFSRCKTEEEREFYIRLSINENYSVRELERQINSSVFERTMMSNVKLPEALKEINANITNAFKDSYIFDFLNLPEPFNESDL